MPFDPNKKAKQIRESRLEKVAALLKNGYSYRAIREEVLKDPAVRSYSLSTVKADVELLLKQWRESRVNDTGLLVQLELERIDDAIRELWDAWEKSKSDRDLKSSKKKGLLGTPGALAGKVQVKEIEEAVKREYGLGDPRYITEIRAQLAERRKLLGLYEPEKQDVRMMKVDITKEDIELFSSVFDKKYR